MATRYNTAGMQTAAMNAANVDIKNGLTVAANHACFCYDASDHGPGDSG
jgi:hypothetical protein